MFENWKQAYLPDSTFPKRTVDKEKCSRCKRCYDACPTYGFELDKDGYPAPIGYGGMEQACLNCWNCVAVCPTGAMDMDGPYLVENGPFKTQLQGTMTYPDPLGLNGTRPYEDFREDLTPTERVIYERRSNRLFKKKPVPKETILRILEAGRFAPSAGNCQPYKFIVVTNKNVIKLMEREAMKTLKFMKNLYHNKDGKKPAWKTALFTALSQVMVNEMDPRPYTAVEKAERCDNAIYWDCPAMIMILKNTHGISNPDLDLGICAQNMVLAAHSLGVGTCYISLSIKPLTYPHMKSFKRKLGITPPWEPVTSIALGYPKGKIDAAVKRDSPQVDWIE
ncbi:MAG: nitroreductase family protein [Desulfatibacillum sp.]|nr:nitroreductase family protein [Desulfatibacillum sp.]